MDIQALEQVQRTLAERVLIPPDKDLRLPGDGDIIVTLDVQYAGKKDAYVAMDICRWPGEPVEVFVTRTEVTEEYIPGYFAFREGPVLLHALRELMQKTSIQPSLLVIDGHGLAHPRKFGVACWMGLETEIPTIGVAKESLVKFTGTLEPSCGSRLPIIVDDETVGYALRTVEGVKPVFVSPGHQVSLEASARIALELAGEYRVIEPVRRADQAARAFARGDLHHPMQPI